jgi:hypothetical protein
MLMISMTRKTSGVPRALNAPAGHSVAFWSILARSSSLKRPLAFRVKLTGSTIDECRQTQQRDSLLPKSPILHALRRYHELVSGFLEVAYAELLSSSCQSRLLLAPKARNRTEQTSLKSLSGPNMYLNESSVHFVSCADSVACQRYIKLNSTEQTLPSPRGVSSWFI